MSNSTDANTTDLVNVTDGSKDLRTSSLNDGQKTMSPDDFPLEDDFDTNVPIYIISMVIGGLLIITIVSTIIFRYKRRRRSDPDHAPIFIPGKPSVKSVTITERAQLAEYQYESNPIFADNLVDKMTCLIENDSMEHRMVLEYESIKSIMPRFSSQSGASSKNRRRNRYLNITPYDYNRVKLLNGDNDYINASYVIGFRYEEEYIICQGPTSATSDDHWQMVFENNVAEIVQLTQFMEEMHSKCHPYWMEEVDSVVKTDKFVITTLTEQSVEDIYSITTLNVQQLASGESRIISIFLFKAWPDHDVPTSPVNLLAFLYAFRSVKRGNAIQPIIVHCSAGVGRSATFIALDIQLQQLATDEKVDVLQCYHRLRFQRCYAIQTFEQYKLVYSSILYHFNNLQNAKYSSV